MFSSLIGGEELLSLPIKAQSIKRRGANKGGKSEFSECTSNKGVVIVNILNARLKRDETKNVLGTFTTVLLLLKLPFMLASYSAFTC